MTEKINYRTVPVGDLTREQVDALNAFYDAETAVRKAWTAVRVAFGEEETMPCSICEGKGEIQTMESVGTDTPEFETCFACHGAARKQHTFPWVVTGFDWSQFKSLSPSRRSGWVSVRPCGEEYGDKTYLGYLLGDIALMPSAFYNDGVVELISGGNPAIFVPELGKVIFGAESWWGSIKSPEDLKKITNEDINNVWYVQALKDLTAKQESEA